MHHLSSILLFQIWRNRLHTILVKPDSRTCEAVLGGLWRAHALSPDTKGKENQGYFVRGIQEIFYGLTEGIGAVLDHFSVVKPTCDSKLGSPHIIKCEHARLEMKEDDELVMNPKDGAIVKFAGTLFSVQPLFPGSLLRCGNTDSAPEV